MCVCGGARSFDRVNGTAAVVAVGGAAAAARRNIYWHIDHYLLIAHQVIN